MTVSVVQSKLFNGADSGSFSANVAAGNTVFLFIFSYANSNITISSSAPTFGGSSVTGASLLMHAQPSSTNTVYCGTWMLPNLAGGAASVALTVTNGIVDSNVGMIGIEVAGLGTSPALDTGAPDPQTATGSTANPASGSTGALAAAPAIVLGMAVGYGVSLTPPASPWTNQQTTSDFTAAGWQVVTSGGGTYSYAATAAAAPWAAGACAVTGGGGAPAASTPQPYVVPSLAAIQAASW